MLFKPVYLSILSSDNAITAQPAELKSLVANIEAFEARLVSLKGVTFKQGNDGEMLIADKENELALNISDNITELPIAGATADVEGFLSHTAKGLAFLPARICNVTGIQAISDNSPAMTNGNLILRQVKEVRIYNTNGSLSGVLHTNSIDLSALPKGTIILHIYHENGSKNVFKISH